MRNYLAKVRRVINGNPKLAIVFSAFACVNFVEVAFFSAEYYLFSAIVFTSIGMISSITAYRLWNKPLFCYAMVNIFAAIMNWIMSFPVGHDLLSHFYWYATINFSLIFLAVELMVILDGGRDAFNFIHNQPDIHHSQRGSLTGVVEGL